MISNRRGVSAAWWGKTLFGFKSLNNQSWHQFIKYQTCSFRKQKSSSVNAVCSSIVGSFQSVTSEAGKHGTTPITTPMSPSSPRAICCFEQVPVLIAHEHKLHLVVEEQITKALHWYSAPLSPKKYLERRQFVLPFVPLSPPNITRTTPLIFIHQRLFIPWAGMKRGAECERDEGGS